MNEKYETYYVDLSKTIFLRKHFVLINDYVYGDEIAPYDNVY